MVMQKKLSTEEIYIIGNNRRQKYTRDIEKRRYKNEEEKFGHRIEDEEVK